MILTTHLGFYTFHDSFGTACTFGQDCPSPFTLFLDHTLRYDAFTHSLHYRPTFDYMHVAIQLPTLIVTRYPTPTTFTTLYRCLLPVPHTITYCCYRVLHHMVHTFTFVGFPALDLHTTCCWFVTRTCRFTHGCLHTQVPHPLLPHTLMPGLPRPACHTFTYVWFTHHTYAILPSGRCSSLCWDHLHVAIHLDADPCLRLLDTFLWSPT